MQSSKAQQGEIRKPSLVINARDTKGTFHAKMHSIKDRNGMDLTEAEDIKTCKNTQKNYKSLGEGS